MVRDDDQTVQTLTKEILRDNMTTLELVLNMLAEAATTQLSKQRRPSAFQENLQTAREGGEVAGSARKDVEVRSGGVPVITSQNATLLNQVVTDMIEGVAADGTESET